jgi:hypothetical protein
MVAVPPSKKILPDATMFNAFEDNTSFVNMETGNDVGMLSQSLVDTLLNVDVSDRLRCGS